jgi:hypothetical protein
MRHCNGEGRLLFVIPGSEATRRERTLKNVQNPMLIFIKLKHGSFQYFQYSRAKKKSPRVPKNPQRRLFPIIVENLVDIKIDRTLIPLNSAAYAFCMNYVAPSNR